jgi:hypothetical protein
MFKLQTHCVELVVKARAVGAFEQACTKGGVNLECGLEDSFRDLLVDHTF